MASFFHGDRPVIAFEYVLPEEAEGAASGTLDVAGQSLRAVITGDEFYGAWKDLTLPEVGSYPVYLTVTRDEGAQRFLVDTLVVVDPEDQWLNVITARADWDGAPTEDGTLYRLLQIAREQVEDYAYPSDLAKAQVPERLRSAQLVQARNTFNSTIFSGDQQQVDLNGNVIYPKPLDPGVRAMIRPKTARKVFG